MAETHEISSHVVDATREDDGNASGGNTVEDPVMQHDIVEIAKNSTTERTQEELNGQIVNRSIQREELLEAVGKALEARHQNETRPLPVLLAGKEVDLFNLCMQVRACGGYDNTTTTSMWSSISERLGFGWECGPSLKLVYMKYLKALESWILLAGEQVKSGPYSELPLHSASSMRLPLKKSAESPSDVWHDDITGVCANSAQRSGKAHQKTFSEGPSKRKRFSDSQKGHVIGNSVVEQHMLISKVMEPLEEAPSRRRRILDSKEGHGVDNIVIEQSALLSKGTESLAGVLEWVKRLALNPGDPRKGQGPRGSKQNEAWVEKCVIIASKVRTALWKRKELVSHGRSSGSLNKQRIPPALYYKELPKPNKQTLEKLRANQIRAMKCGFYRSASRNTFDAHAIRSTWLSISPSQMLAVGRYSEQASDHSNTYLKCMNDMVGMGYLLNNNAARKRIPIGPDFQAHVPPWTNPAKPPYKESEVKDGSPSSDNHSWDSESMLWVGSLVWPHSGLERVVSKSRIGRGRSDDCACANPASIECVRSHVLEEREKLKLELSVAFDSWGFHDMGETVSELWTEEEESMFELAVRLNPLSLGKNFWNDISAAFPSKTTKELVSYYFNVFVLRRRAMENRTVPESVDSDNDERELECDVDDGLIMADSAYKDSMSVQDSNHMSKNRIIFNNFGLRICNKGTLLTSTNIPPTFTVFTGEGRQSAWLK